MSSFIYALKSPETKRQYPKRFAAFLIFLGYEGTLEFKAKLFLTNTRKNAQWAEAELMKFFNYYREQITKQ
jgi:hypothetical protein